MVWRQAGPLEQRSSYGTLQGCKTKSAARVPFQNELNAAIAKVADPIEKNDGRRRMAYFKL